MEENQGPSNYELANSLPAIDTMDRTAAQQEIARMNSAGPDHPFWSEFHLDHRAAVSRLQRLLDHVRITPEEKAARTQEAKKKLDEESDRLWAAHEKQRAEEEIQKGQDRLKERLAAEGKSVTSEEAGKIIDNAGQVFEELEKEGIVDPTFRDFLEEAGEDGQEPEGDRIENVQAFATLSGLLTRFRSWSEKKGKGQE
jgi:hypothetical protein